MSSLLLDGLNGNDDLGKHFPSLPPSPLFPQSSHQGAPGVSMVSSIIPSALVGSSASTSDE